MECGEQATVLPMLLHGKLVDIFIKLNEDTRADLTALKKALMNKEGLTKDPLVAGKEFITWTQQEGETVSSFAGDLLKVVV